MMTAKRNGHDVIMDAMEFCLCFLPVDSADRMVGCDGVNVHSDVVAGSADGVAVGSD